MPFKPPALHPGDTIGIVAPASPPKDPAQLEAGMAHLRSLGYRVETVRGRFEPYGYLCGTDEQRLEELNGFLRRDDVQALFCVRGGFGALRLLPHLDYDAMRRHPKLVVGYSDITALHLAFLEKAGVVGISGPMVAVEWGDPDARSERLFWQAAQGEVLDPLLGPGGEPLTALREGAAEGTLIGGNLSIIARLVGTPFLPSLKGAILFLEEVGEEPYRVDGLLAQLKLAGVLDQLGGLIFGGFTDAAPTGSGPTLTMEQVFHHYADEVACPVARDLVYGHFPVKSALPVGVRARLRVTSGSASLSLLESVVDS